MQTGLSRKKVMEEAGAIDMNFRRWMQLMLFLLLNASCFFMDTRPWALGSSSLIGQLCYATDLDTKPGPKLHRTPSVSGGCSIPDVLDFGYLGEFSGLGNMPRSAGNTQLCVSDEDYVAIDTFSGVGCFGRALVDIMVERMRKAYILSLDNMAEANLRALCPELGKYIDDGSILFFQMDLYQLEEKTLPILLRSLLGIPMSKVNWFHYSIDCAVVTPVDP